MTLVAINDAPAASPCDAEPSLRVPPRLLMRTDVRLALILIVCFIPRAILAWKLTAVCDDAYYYGHLADSLDRGHFEQALEYLNINVYPILLMLLHRLGLDWIVAGKLWGVLIGTALVLPMFDWLRRMFDERIATAAVFLYAVHPKIIESTAEPIREVTFWFLFVLCLDLFWRCARERKWWQFIAAGASLALALHTRIEAWFLLVPLGAWIAASWWRIPHARARLVAGSLLCLAITPLFILLVNVTLLANHSQWELGRLGPLLLVGKWARAPLHVATPTPAIPSVPQVDSQVGTSDAGTDSTPRMYVHEVTRTLGVVFLVLSLIGFIRGRRQLLHPNKAVLGFLTLAVLLAIWVRLSQIGNLNGRYFLLLVFIDAPFAALGGLFLIRQLERFTRARRIGWLRPGHGTLAFAACLLLAGWAQALASHHNHRDMEARLGRWIDARAGRFRSVVSDLQSMRPAYAAGRDMPDVVLFDEFFQKRFDRSPPDLAIFFPAWYRPELLPHLVRRAERIGLTPLDQTSFSSAKPEFVIFVRKNVQADSTPTASGGNAIVVR
jgi:hypothetical protein